MEKIIIRIRNKGFVDSIYSLISYVVSRAIFRFRATFQRIRGYRIDKSVILFGRAELFQSKKNSITIGKNTTVGFGTRIRAGFNGKITIGENVLIDDYSYVMAQSSVYIGDNTLVASSCYIIDFNHKYPLYEFNKYGNSEKSYERKPIRIGKYVWIGTHVVILPGVEIGDHVVIGAGSIVTKSIPAYTLAVGNPAKVIKRYRKSSKT